MELGLGGRKVCQTDRQTDRKSGTPKKTKKMRERQRDENCCKHRERLGRVAHRETYTHTHTYTEGVIVGSNVHQLHIELLFVFATTVELLVVELYFFVFVLSSSWVCMSPHGYCFDNNFGGWEINHVQI